MRIYAFHKGPRAVGKDPGLDLDKPKNLSTVTELDLNNSSRLGLVNS